MKQDTDMIVRHFGVVDEIEVYPIGDVHLGAAEHMADAWKQFCDYIIGRPHAYVILIGDLINNGTRTSVTNIFEETMRPSEQKRMMAEMLKPLRDRIIAIIPGNHEAARTPTMIRRMTSRSSSTSRTFIDRTRRSSSCRWACGRNTAHTDRHTYSSRRTAPEADSTPARR